MVKNITADLSGDEIDEEERKETEPDEEEAEKVDTLEKGVIEAAENANLFKEDGDEAIAGDDALSCEEEIEECPEDEKKENMKLGLDDATSKSFDRVKNAMNEDYKMLEA